METGNADDLAARLRTLASASDSRRLVLVVGSGLSNGAVPDVRGMIALFRNELDPAGQLRVDEMAEDSQDWTLIYQNAASLVRNRVGEWAVGRAIRRGVLEARPDLSADDRNRLCDDLNKCAAMVSEPGWTVPIGYRKLAAIYAALPSAQRGPVVTTNFDPLMTLALREAGVPAESIPIPLDSAPSPDQLAAAMSIPVLHVHGYWSRRDTLNGIGQLTRPRPALEGTLREVIRNSVVLVIGYGGWPDAFMKSLAERVREANFLGSEVLWALHGTAMADSNAVADFVGVPGFSIYESVDANRLETETADSVPQAKAPYGFAHAEPGGAYSADDARRFADGGQPGWADARQWPRLTSTHELLATVREAIFDGSGPRLVVASGPVGEGKSLALRQVAAVLSDDSDSKWTAIWKEPGGGRMTAEWFAGIGREYPYTVVFVDDADLVASDLRAARDEWRSRDDIVIVAAMHDRLWRHHRPALNGLFREVRFGGLGAGDAQAIAAAWQQFGIAGGPSASEVGIAERLEESAHRGGAGGTLFGAVLDVRFGDGLEGRVRDLVDKLRGVPLPGDSPLSVGDIFLGICLLQECGRPDGAPGASRALVASMAGLPGILADGYVLGALGREAAISFAGSRVVTRHPVIARHAVSYAAQQGSLEATARLVGKAGAAMRSAGGIPVDDFRDAYGLGRLVKEKGLAIAAANGALEGAPHLLEARTTRMAVLRKFDPDGAQAYGLAVGAHLDDFVDARSAVRGYLNEFAQISLKISAPMRAVGLAVLALADDVGYHLDHDRAQYALVTLCRAAVRLRGQQRSLVARTPEASYALLRSMPGGSELCAKYLSIVRADLLDLSMSVESAVSSIQTECSRAARECAEGMPGVEDAVRNLTLRDLLRLVEANRPAPGA